MKLFVIVMATSFVVSLFGLFVSIREEMAASLTTFEDIGMIFTVNGLFLYFVTVMVFKFVNQHYCMFVLKALVVLIIYEVFAMFPYLLYRRMKRQQERKPNYKNHSIYQKLDED